MTQHLWYVRTRGKQSGPFPAPQVRQAHQLGELAEFDEVSLDGQHWITLAESGLVSLEDALPQDTGSAQDDAWRLEREKARLRWLNDAIETHEDGTFAAKDDEVSSRLRRHEEDTRSLMSARLTRRPAVVAGLLGLLATILIGLAIWYGQSDDTGIQAAFVRQISRCDQPPNQGIVWAGCDKSGSDLRNASLANGKLAGALFERADMSSADLSYADLDRARLRGTSLRNANLRGASLRNADLTGADLSGANLEYAVLSGAIMEGVRMDGSRLNQSTMPDGRVCGEASVGECR